MFVENGIGTFAAGLQEEALEERRRELVRGVIEVQS